MYCLKLAKQSSKNSKLSKKKLKSTTKTHFYEHTKRILLSRSCSEVYGTLNVSSLVGVPISGCIGDQQGALVGQNCWRPGQAVTTLGSSSCTMYNAGPRIVDSEAGLVSTVAYQVRIKLTP